MSLRLRVLIALTIGLLAGVVSYYLLATEGRMAHDFTWPWAGARDLLAGHNPYETAFSDQHPFYSPLFYPLPAVLLAVPLAGLPAPVAGAVFMGVSSAALAFGVSVKGRWHLLPIFASAPFLVSLKVGQWAPLMVAVALLPVSYRALLICKPNVGLALFTRAPSRGVVAGVAVLGLASLLILPEWPFWWLASMRLGVDSHVSPLRIFPGPFLLLAALHWRKQEGRLLLAMALIPQHPYWYDSLPLWLIPQTWGESLFLSVASLIGLGVSTILMPGIGPVLPTYFVWPWHISSIYLPALGIVLWRYRPRTAQEMPVGSPAS